MFETQILLFSYCRNQSKTKLFLQARIFYFDYIIFYTKKSNNKKDRYRKSFATPVNSGMYRVISAEISSCVDCDFFALRIRMCNGWYRYATHFADLQSRIAFGPKDLFGMEEHAGVTIADAISVACGAATMDHRLAERIARRNSTGWSSWKYIVLHFV